MRISDWSLDVCSSDLKSISVLRPATASKTMSPPLPPLPPSGPPYSIYFSRRNDTAPGPPSPDLMKILAWSRKCMAGPLGGPARFDQHGGHEGRLREASAIPHAAAAPEPAVPHNRQ